MDKVGKSTLETMNKAVFYNRWLLSLLAPHLKGDILEIGGGIGNFTKKLQRFGNVTSTDIDKFYISKLKKILSGKNAGFGDIEKGSFFFTQKKFDGIVCLNVLEHIKDDDTALKNMYTLLRRNGKLLLLVPAHQIAFSKIDKGLGHYRRYTKESLRSKAIEAGFSITEIRYLNILGIVGRFINGKILKKTTLPQGQLSLFDKVAIPLLLLEKRVRFPFGLSVFLVAYKK